MPKCVVLSDRAMTSILVETHEKIATETGGVFLGYKKDDIWYVVESIDPGPNSTFRTTYFEYDQDYINHLINKISRLYSEQLDLIGLWHRHPGSMDSFSSTDDITNTKYAEIDGTSAISALVNIDPEFRLTVYKVELPLSYTKIRYVVGDANMPDGLLNYVNNNKLIAAMQRVNQQVKEKSSFDGLTSKFLKNLNNAERTEDELKAKISFSSAIHQYLKKRTFGSTVSKTLHDFQGEYPIDEILKALEADLDYLGSEEIKCKMIMNENGFLEFHEETNNNKIPCELIFGMSNGQVVFEYNELIYNYKPDLFRKVCLDCLVEKKVMQNVGTATQSYEGSNSRKDD